MDTIASRTSVDRRPESGAELRLSLSSALQDQAPGSAGWWYENTVVPAVHTAVGEPYNALAHVVNAGANCLLTKAEPVKLLPELAHYEPQPVALWSKEWFVRNISSGLAMAVPYGIAGALTGRGLHRVGAALEAKGMTATVLKSREAAMIAGAFCYDGLKVPREGETRIGNACGGAVGFAIFEAGNLPIKNWKTGWQIPARMLVGTAGALGQYTVSHLVSGQQMKRDQLFEVAMSGATMNVVLPYTHKFAEKGVNSLSQSLGLGSPLDLHLRLKYGEKAIKEDLPLLQALIDLNPWARAQEGAKHSEANSETNTVRIATGEALPERYGHELWHLLSQRSGELEGQFKEAAKLLGESREEAWKAYRNVRLRQEVDACLVELIISKQRAEKGATLSTDELMQLSAGLRAKLPGLTAVESKTYEQMWRAEFEQQFAPSAGKFRPAKDYGGDWHQPWDLYTRLSYSEKVELAESLYRQPHYQVCSMWRSLFEDGDCRIRYLAVERLGDLPQEHRPQAWQRAVEHGDYLARALAVSMISCLPEANSSTSSGDVFSSWSFGARLYSNFSGSKSPVDFAAYVSSAQNSRSYNRAYTAEFTQNPRAQALFEVLLNKTILELPADDNLTQRYGREHCAGRVPEIPFDATPHQSRVWGSSPAEHVVRQLGCLPPELQPLAWKAAADNPHTAPYVVPAIRLIPVDARYDAWCRALDVQVNRLGFSSNADEPAVRLAIDELLAQVEHLPAEKQQEARDNATGWRESTLEAPEGRRYRPTAARSVDWAETLRTYGELSEARKVEVASGLKFAPEKTVMNVWTKLLQDESCIVRYTAVQSLGDLPAKLAKGAWQQAVNHPDYLTRALAITQIRALPADQRVEAWHYVLNQPRVLALPFKEPEEGERPAKPQRAAPFVSFDVPERFRSLLVKGPEALLVEQIECLPGVKAREAAWKVAASDSRTRISALSNLSVLPEGSRGGVWLSEWRTIEAQRLADQSGSDFLQFLRRKAANKTEVEVDLATDSRPKRWAPQPVSEHGVLVDQIPVLAPAHRLRAWDSFIAAQETNNLAGRIATMAQVAELADTNAISSSGLWLYQVRWLNNQKTLSVSDHGVRAALASLPETLVSQPRSRTGEWYRLLDALAKTQREYEQAAETVAATRVGRYSINHHLGSSSVQGWLRNSAVREVQIGRALGALPEHARMDAWYCALGELGKSYYEQLATCVQLLPQSQRLRALKHLAAEPDCYSLRRALPDAVRHVGGEHLPQVVRVLMSLPAEVRNDCWSKVSTSNVLPWNAAEAAKVLKQFFDVLKENKQEIPEPVLRRLWQDIDYFEHDGVRAKLAQELPPEFLARLFFEGEGLSTGEKFAKEHPEIIRRLALSSSTSLWEPAKAEPQVMALAANVWMATADLNATAGVILAALKKQVDPKHLTENPPTLQLIVELARLGSPEDNGRLMHELARKALDRHPAVPDAQLLQLGCKLAANSPQAARQNFLAPLEAAIADQTKDYMWRLNTARELGRLSREGALPEPIRVPDMRMKGVELPAAERERVLAMVEDALQNPEKLAKLLGEDGELGRLFPGVFGRYEKTGGIVGRPQHGGHEFTIDVHTVLVVERVRNHPEFHLLSKKDQINVLWAAFLHDVGKKAAVSDPGHEWVSANLGWGVLETFGYPTERIQRIANLVSRHVEVSYSPHKHHSQLFAEQPGKLVEMAVFYRHPSAMQQLLILNEADIRSIDGLSKYWTPTVREELHKVATMVGRQRQILDQCAVPILTTELPRQFGVFTLKDKYAVLAHQSDHLATAFLDQLALIESTEYSMSGTWITNDYKQMRSNDGQVVVLVTGPAEHVAQAGRENLGTGCNVDWRRHVELCDKAPKNMGDFVKELDLRLAANAQTSHNAPPHLRALWRSTSQFDNLSQLLAKGEHDPVVTAYNRLMHAMTHSKTDLPLKGHNEVKMINAKVTGIGLVRMGKPVVFEGMSPEQARQLLGGNGSLPSWVVTSPSAPLNSLVVPRSVWQAAMNRGWPIVSLE